MFDVVDELRDMNNPMNYLVYSERRREQTTRFITDTK